MGKFVFYIQFDIFVEVMGKGFIICVICVICVVVYFFVIVLGIQVFVLLFVLLGNFFFLILFCFYCCWIIGIFYRGVLFIMDQYLV